LIFDFLGFFGSCVYILNLGENVYIKKGFEKDTL
jgi:hypothetical protein